MTILCSRYTKINFHNWALIVWLGYIKTLIIIKNTAEHRKESVSYFNCFKLPNPLGKDFIHSEVNSQKYNVTYYYTVLRLIYFAGNGIL